MADRHILIIAITLKIKEPKVTEYFMREHLRKTPNIHRSFSYLFTHWMHNRSAKSRIIVKVWNWKRLRLIWRNEQSVTNCHNSVEISCYYISFSPWQLWTFPAIHADRSTNMVFPIERRRRCHIQACFCWKKYNCTRGTEAHRLCECNSSKVCPRLMKCYQ